MPLVMLIWPLGFAYGFTQQAWRHRRHLWASRPQIRLSNDTRHLLLGSAAVLVTLGCAGLVTYGFVLYVWPLLPSFSITAPPPRGTAVDIYGVEPFATVIMDVICGVWVRLLGTMMTMWGLYRTLASQGGGAPWIGIGIGLSFVPTAVRSMLASPLGLFP
jgi:hypothetical protein